ncbi:SLAP domain-containing protein [Companilactobacillus zhachilii]|uniref:SLAP domain-containing protein n=1 Tax=Companilactobacillus zhachilii TaxID=2304606 RepID=UPI0019230B65|nr:SLAP domain-containing protein [Companilactobacillus zhachilii]MBL3530523.1 SLAP domain-containing protein [Companilactobacillus zhachilii]
MKLRMNKFTMVCAVVLSSAVLFGTNSVNVQAADNTGGSSVASLSKDEYKYEEFYSEQGDPEFGTIPFALYKTNGDEHNLQLRIGNTDLSKVEVLGYTEENTDVSWYARYPKDVTSVVIVGNVKADKDQGSLFSSMPQLTSVTGLDKLDTSSAVNLSHMFDGDKALSSVDLSDIDMSSARNTDGLFSGTNLSTLTLGNKSVLSASCGIPTTYTLDGKTYSSNTWYNKSQPNATPITTDKLIEMYSADSTGDKPHVTWTRVNPVKQVDYYIQYVDSSTGKVIPGATYDTNEKGVVGDKIDLSLYSPSKVGRLQSGYESQKASSTGVIESDGAGKYYVKVPIAPLAAVKISVSQKIGSDAPKDVSFKIPINDTSYKYADIANPANTTIDLNKSTIKIGDKDAESFAKYSSTSKDLNSILSAAITSQYNKSNVFGDDAAGTTPITVNAVYTKKSTSGGSSSSGSQHNSSNNNENSTENNTENKGGTTTEVKQTISTTNKDVNLYDKDGKLITDRVLAENSAWFSDQTYDLNGTSYYRVANDEYVKASDVYIYTAENHIVDVKGKSIVFMVDSNGHKVTNRALGPNSEWYSDRYMIINGQKYYRVATDEFVSAADIALL